VRRLAEVGDPVRRALIALALALAVAGATALALGADGEGSQGKRYEIVLDNAFGLSEGGDLRVAGVRAGTTGEARVIRGGRRPLAVVEAQVTEKGFADLRADAGCEVRPQSFIGEYYVDCQPGTSRERLPEGGRVPVEQTSSAIPLDLVNDVMRLPYRQRLRIIVGELGAGLAGRPEELSEVLGRAHPGLRETEETLRILGRQTRTIERFVADAGTVVSALESRKRDVTRFVREAGQTAEVAASRRDRLAETFDRLPAFLGELDPYMLRLGQLAGAQSPVLRDLRAGSDELDTLLTRLPPFADAGRPALAALGDAALVGRRAVRESEEELDELRRLARDAPGLAKPLRQFLETIDDRERAVEPDARAAATDPPAPDKTHISRGRGGFTGMEAIWNFFFWQALTTNGLDDIGHVLRVAITVMPGGCSDYFFTRGEEPEEQRTFDECNQWMGPYQPGINAPDPTEGGASAAAAPASTPSPPAGGGTPPGAAGPATRDAGTAPLLDYLLRP
jgi:ABC-type transporter Mla subunit MlaD